MGTEDVHERNASASEKGTEASRGFRVDHELRVVHWGRQVSDLTGRSPADAEGRPYFEVMPRIIVNGEDALRTALEEDRTLSLPNHQFVCFHCQVSADVTIRPLAPKVSPPGAEVSLENVTFCPDVQKSHYIRQLVNMGKISSTLAHGVRNPLNSIKGAATFLAEKYPHESLVVEFTGIISQEIDRLDEFVARFLSASVPDLEHPTADVRIVAEKVQMMTSMQLRANGIVPIYRLDRVPAVAMNPFQLEQALLNVVTGAQDFIPSGGSFRVSTREDTAGPKPWIIVEASHTGSGAPVRSSGDPTGLGLFIAREIMQSHGGSLEIESEAGTGTTVRLLIPAVH